MIGEPPEGHGIAAAGHIMTRGTDGASFYQDVHTLYFWFLWWFTTALWPKLTMRRFIDNGQHQADRVRHPRGRQHRTHRLSSCVRLRSFRVPSYFAPFCPFFLIALTMPRPIFHIHTRFRQ